MAKCEWCGKEFDESYAEMVFSSETMLEYANLNKCLCDKCAVQAIEDQVDGVYFETCESCGKRFDLFEDSSRFSSIDSNSGGMDLRDWWISQGQILCCDCAEEAVEKLKEDHD